MTNANVIANTATEQLINHRLDVIDRALLDLLPRNERLALVAQVEARARDMIAASATSADAAHSGHGAWSLSPLTAPAFLAGIGRRRSRLAITAGVLGIAALLLLFATPVIYVVVGLLGEIIGEIGAIVLAGIHVGLVTLGGLAAVGLAVAALVILKRRRGALGGHGWAIAGLCTGPLPILGGLVTGLILGGELLGAPLGFVATMFSDTAPTVEYSVSDPSSPPQACYGVPQPSPTPPGASPYAYPAGLPAVSPVPYVANTVPSDPADPRLLLAPQPAAVPTVQPTAGEAPASEPETRPEPPGVPEG